MYNFGISDCAVPRFSMLTEELKRVERSDILFKFDEKNRWVFDNGKRRFEFASEKWGFFTEALIDERIHSDSSIYIFVCVCVEREREK
jgi:hypothetical protein